MPLLFEKFIGFFLWIESKGQHGLYTVCHVSTKKTIQIFFLSVYVCVYGLSLCGEGRGNHTEIYHHCFEEAFSSFMVVFTTGVRLNPTSKVSIDFFLYVYFDRNKQQPQHSWTGANVLAHFNVFLFFSDI